MSLIHILKKVSVNCDFVKGIRVDFKPAKPFSGRIYTRDYLDAVKCSNSYQNAQSMSIILPFNECGTKKRSENTYSNVIIVQRNAFLITADDSAYEIICEPFNDINDTFVTQEITAEIGPLLEPTAIFTATSVPPIIYMNIYDFRKDAYVRNVKLGQIYELEIDIKSSIYSGFVKNCLARSENKQNFTLLDAYGCPADVRIFDKAYIDDQSKTTGHYYIYMPFEVFLFSSGGNKVTFQCDVLICREGCQPVDCGASVKHSYGRRKKRKKRDLNGMASRSDNDNDYPTTNSDPGLYTETTDVKANATEIELKKIDDNDMVEKPLSQTINVISDTQILERTINDLTDFDYHDYNKYSRENDNKNFYANGSADNLTDGIIEDSGIFSKFFPSKNGTRYLGKFDMLLLVLGSALTISVGLNILFFYKFKYDKTSDKSFANCKIKKASAINPLFFRSTKQVDIAVVKKNKKLSSDIF
ncbi:unnamed protein product [Gordionus sp. m RMFG-2023]